MLVLIIIGSVIAYLAIGGVILGLLSKTRFGVGDEDNKFLIIIWPMLLFCILFIGIITILTKLPIKFGEYISSFLK